MQQIPDRGRRPPEQQTVGRRHDTPVPGNPVRKQAPEQRRGPVQPRDQLLQLQDCTRAPNTREIRSVSVSMGPTSSPVRVFRTSSTRTTRKTPRSPRRQSIADWTACGPNTPTPLAAEAFSSAAFQFQLGRTL